MKFGIYNSYWEREWSADCLKYVEKVAKLGFDILEIAAHHLNSYSPARIAELGRSAKDNGITFGFSSQEWQAVKRLFAKAWNSPEVSRTWDKLIEEYGEL